MKKGIFSKGMVSLIWQPALAIILLSSLLLNFVGTSASYAAIQPYAVTVSRSLPASVIPSQTFNVTVSFTAPADNFNAIGLSDFAPSGWSVSANNSWNAPTSDSNNVSSNRIDYIWNGPFSNGTAFTAVYHVTVPSDAAPGTYYFTNASPVPHLEYYVGGDNYSDNITGQSQITVINLPQVSGSSPGTGAASVATNSAIQVTFNKAMDHASTQGAFSISPSIAGSFAWSSGDTVLTYTPASKLAFNTVYTATVSTAATDQATPANHLTSNYVFSFTTEIQPAVSSTVPTNNATGVAINSAITITFNKPMAQTATQNAFSIDNGANGAFSWNSGANAGTILTFTPAPNLLFNTLYHVTIGSGAQDLNGNVLAQTYTFAFTTASATAPTVTTGAASSITTSGAILNGTLNTLGSATSAAISFEYWANATPQNKATVNVVTPVTSAPQSVTASITGLTPGTTYGYHIIALGNYNGATAVTGTDMTFTTDIIPAVVSTGPAAGATNVNVSASIQVTFNKAMDHASTQAAFSISPSITGSFAWSSGDTVLTYTPASKLAFNTVYTATISTAATDQAPPANHLTSNYVFSFTTEIQPAVSSTVPTNNATGVAINSAITITFNKPMAQTATQNAFSIDNGANGAFSWNSGANAGTILTFTPAPNLLFNTLYHVTIGSGAQDLNGNVLAQTYTFAFTTASATAPTVTTGAASSITTSGAILNGTLNTLGSATSAAISFEYWANATPQNKATVNVVTPVTSAPQSVTASITGLTPGTTYGYHIIALGNYNGATAVTGTDMTFTTDIIPAVVSTGPAAGATNVNVSASIQVTFNKAMDHASTQAAFSISPSKTGSFTWSPDDKTLTFTPGSKLAFSTAYTATISTAATDQAPPANHLTSNYVFSFTTEIQPAVSSTVPTNNATGVAINSAITITFNKPMAQTATQNAFGIDNGANGAFSWNSGANAGTILTFTPAPNLLFSTLYHVTIGSGAQDLNGNVMTQAYSFSFTTEIQPAVSSTVPTNNATGVAINSAITITFNKPMAQTATQNAFSIDNGANGAFSWNSGANAGTILTFTPAPNLLFNTLYHVTIGSGAQDLNGNVLAQTYTFAFTTASATAPTVTTGAASSITTSGAILNGTLNTLGSATSAAISFEYWANATPQNKATVNVVTPVTSAPQSVTASITGLTPGTTYGYHIIALGNYNGATAVTGTDMTFTTDIIPAVVSTGPAAGATNVNVSASIQVTFNKAMDHASTQAAFSISPSKTGSFTWSPDDKTLTFTPGSKLAFSTAYTATISTAATDQAPPANHLTSNYVFSFTTEIQPAVSSTVPTNNATGVAINSAITITFNKPMAQTATQNAFSIDNGANGAFSWNSGANAGTILTFTPAPNLLFSTLYHVTIGSGAQDLNGNVMTQAYSFSFTTEVQPAVISTVPTNNATGVAINSAITITFNKPMAQTATQNAFSIDNGANGAFSWNSGANAGTILTFTPAPNLLFNTLYHVTIGSGAQDLNGNVLAQTYTFAFTTASATAPTVTTGAASSITTSGAILNGTLNTLGSATSAAISFEYWANATPQNKATVNVVTPVTSAPQSVTASITGLTPGTTYGYHIIALGNYNGATAVTGTDMTFTTDIIPAVVSTGPAAGATNVNVSASIQVTFNKAMDHASTQAAFSISPSKTGSFTWSPDDKTLTFTPGSKLAFSTAYTATISTAATDQAPPANHLTSNYVFSFTTEVQPAVSSTVPTNNATGVAINSAITITFNKPMAQTATQNAFSIDNGANGAFSWNSGANAGTILTFTPAPNLLFNTLYHVTIGSGAQDLNGNVLAQTYTFAFTTASATAPTVTTGAASSITTSGAILNGTLNTLGSATSAAISFEYWANATPQNKATVNVVTPVTSAPQSVTASITGLTPGTTYGYHIIALGNYNGATAVTGTDMTFTTDIIPAVVSTGPAAGATNVNVSASIQVTFNKAMDHASTQAAFSISPSKTGSFTWSPDDKTLTFTPGSKLAFSTAYTATISTAATDQAPPANHLTSNYVFSFTTEIQPAVSSTVPTNNATGVAINSAITITFNKPMAQTATNNAVSISPPVTGNPAYSWNEQSTVLTYTPGSSLAYSAYYSLSISTAAVDLNGNSLASIYTSNFTTTKGLISITVTPTDISIPKGRTQLFSANPNYSDGTHIPPVAVIWSSSDSGKITIDAISGLATAVAVTSAPILITASSGGINGTSTVSVTPAVLDSIKVNPDPVSVPKGRNQKFAATGTYSDGTQSVLSSLVWTSSNTAKATIDPNSGVATTVAVGSSLISASTISGANTLTSNPANLTITSPVLDSITISPSKTASTSVAKGYTQQFYAAGNYSDGTHPDLTNVVNWTSSDTTKVTIGLNTGLANAKAITGDIFISAALGSISDTSTMAVTAAVVTGLVISPAGPSLAKGNSLQFILTASYSDGTTVDETGAASWVSADTNIADFLSPTTKNLITAKSSGSTTITARYSDTSGSHIASTPLTVTAPTLEKFIITETSPSTPAGQTLQLHITPTYSDGSHAPVPAGIIWSSANLATATANTTSGLVSGLLPGTVNITASVSGLKSTVLFTVSPAVLTSIAVTPANATIPAGNDVQFTATGTYSDGHTAGLTTGVTWSSSDATYITCNTTTGQAHAKTPTSAPVAVMATVGNVSGSTSLSVTSANLTSITIAPTAPSIAAGLMQPFIATGKYSDSSSANITGLVTWNSSNISIATINAFGIATGIVSGNSTITAISGNMSNQTTLTVTAPILTSISVTPPITFVPAGLSRQFIVKGTYSDGSIATLTSGVTWSSSDAAIATVVSASGLATGVTANATPVMITAKATGVPPATAALTVTAPLLNSITVSTDHTSIPAGNTAGFTAMGTYSNGVTANITKQVIWSSSAITIAGINSAGVATGAGTGTTSIIATTKDKDVTGSTDLTVTSAVISSIIVSPVNRTITLGGSQQFRAMATYSNGSKVDITTVASWNSGTSGIATIGPHTGLASSVAAGVSAITASSGSITSDPVNLTVTTSTLSSIAITPGAPSQAAGRTQAFAASGTYSDNSNTDITSQVTWVSSNVTSATINAAGLATTLAPGATGITAIFGSVTSPVVTLNVGPAVLDSVVITPPNPEATLYAGHSQTFNFTATAVFSDGSVQNVTADPAIIWTSNTPGSVTINGSGTANLGAWGNTGISAAYNGITSATVTFTVLPDTTPPVVTMTNPPQGLAVNQKSLTITGQVDDTAATASLILNGAAIPVTLDAGGNFSRGVILNAGYNTLLVTSTDQAGNTGTSGTRVVIVDPNKPSVNLLTPADGYTTNQPSISVTGTAISTNGSVENCTLTLNGKSQTLPVVSGNFSAMVNLTEGTNIIAVNAYSSGHAGDADYLGTSGVISVLLDTVAPLVTITSPPNGAIVNVPGINVTGKVNDPSVSAVILSLNGIPQNIPVSSGNFSQNVNLAPGANAIFAIATDKFGNTSASGSPVIVTLNTSKPVVTITSPANGSFTNISYVTINGTLNNPAITAATLYLNNVSQPVSIGPDGSFSQAVVLAMGTNTIEVRASDNAAPPNSGTSGVINVTLDTSPPVLNIGLSDPTDSFTLTISSNKALRNPPSVSVHEDPNITSASITIAEVDINQWLAVYNIPQPGNYTVIVTGVDQAGNGATQTATFTKTTISTDGVKATTVSNATTTLQVQTNGAVNNASLTVTQHNDNPSGNVGYPAGINSSTSVFVEINASTELRDNLKKITIQVSYNPADLPAGTNESTLKLYLWDVTSGTWSVVPGSTVDTINHLLTGTVSHLSQYGVFGINLASTSTTVTSSANPSTYGQSVTFTANVIAVSPATGTPTGAVTFQDGTATLGTVNLNNSGQATCTTSILTAGGHTITAIYNGDSNFVTSSGTLTQTVLPSTQIPVALVFTTQPAGATAGSALTMQPVVAIEDAQGNIVASSTAAVTLAITSGTGTQGAVLSGTLTVNVVNGVATFSGLSIDLAGTGYTLTATTGSPALTKTSNAFDISGGSSGPVGGGGGGYVTPRPTISSLSVADGATGVGVNVPLTVVFAGAMDPTTLNTTTFTLMKGTTSVSGTVTYDSATYALKFTPSAPLDYNTLYTATITTGARNTSGYGLSGNYSWSFTTAAAPTPTPSKPVTTTTPPPPSKPATATISPPASPTPSIPATSVRPSTQASPSVTMTTPATPPPPPPGTNWWLIIGIIIIAAIVVVTVILVVRRASPR